MLFNFLCGYQYKYDCLAVVRGSSSDTDTVCIPVWFQNKTPEVSYRCLSLNIFDYCIYWADFLTIMTVLVYSCICVSFKNWRIGECIVHQFEKSFSFAEQLNSRAEMIVILRRGNIKLKRQLEQVFNKDISTKVITFPDLPPWFQSVERRCRERSSKSAYLHLKQILVALLPSLLWKWTPSPSLQWRKYDCRAMNFRHIWRFLPFSDQCTSDQFLQKVDMIVSHWKFTKIWA